MDLYNCLTVFIGITQFAVSYLESGWAMRQGREPALMSAYAHKAARSRRKEGCLQAVLLHSRLARSPCGATSPVPCHLYANKPPHPYPSPPVPYRFQHHKTNMCCFISADKRKRKKEKRECCFSQTMPSLFSVTQELIKPDSVWMLSPSCFLCKQLGETDHFNGRLWLQLITCTHSANSLFHCCFFLPPSLIFTFMPFWQPDSWIIFFFYTKEAAIKSTAKGKQSFHLI